MTRIHLVRHGRSAHVHKGWLTHHELPSWREKYDAAGLIDGEHAPETVRALVATADLLVSSDLPRAIESAGLLRPGVPCEQSPLLREVDLPIPQIGAVRLPLWMWGHVIGINWLVDRARGMAEAQARAVQGAEWLAARAASHDSVVAVTHGAFRYYLASALLQRGWTARGKRSFSHWSVWELERATPPRAASEANWPASPP